MFYSNAESFLDRNYFDFNSQTIYFLSLMANFSSRSYFTGPSLKDVFLSAAIHKTT